MSFTGRVTKHKYLASTVADNKYDKTTFVLHVVHVN